MSWIGSDSIPFSEIGMTQSKFILLKELAEGSVYWKNALVFVNTFKDTKLSSMTNPQRCWLTTIILGLDDGLERGSWRH